MHTNTTLANDSMRLLHLQDECSLGGCCKQKSQVLSLEILEIADLNCVGQFGIFPLAKFEPFKVKMRSLLDGNYGIGFCGGSDLVGRFLAG